MCYSHLIITTDILGAPLGIADFYDGQELGNQFRVSLAVSYVHSRQIHTWHFIIW